MTGRLAYDRFAAVFGAGRGGGLASATPDEPALDLRERGGVWAVLNGDRVEFYLAEPHPDTPAAEISHWGQLACTCSVRGMRMWFENYRRRQLPLHLGVEVTLDPDAGESLDTWLAMLR